MKTLPLLLTLALALPLGAAESPASKAPAAVTKPAGDPGERLAALKATFPQRKSAKTAGITFDVPAPDIWSNYRGYVQTATVASLAATLARIDQAIEADIAKLTPKAQQTSNRSEAAQARQTLAWIKGTLRPYLTKLRAISG